MTKQNSVNKDTLNKFSEIESYGLYKLPSNWRWARLKDIVEHIQYGYTETSSLEEIGPKFLRITDIQNDSVNWEQVPYCKINESDLNKFKLENDDILIARTGATTGKSFLITDPPLAVFASYLIRIRCKENICPKYVWNFMKSSIYWNQITVMKKGSAQPGANAKVLADLIIPIPPLAEQKRISRKIVNLLNKIDEVKKMIEEAEESIKIRQAAILDRAFRGELVNTNKQKKQVEINKQITLDIPIDWEVKSFNEIVDSFSNQREPVSQSKREEMKGDTPYYGATGVVDYIDGYTHEGDFLCIGEDGANLLSRSKPQAFIIKGKSWVNNHAHVVRAKVEVSNKYLMHYMNFIPLNDYITGTAQPKLNKRNLDKILVAIPTIDEQVEIINKIDYLLGKESEVLKNCHDVINVIEELKSSILNKAFRGKLGTNKLKEEIIVEPLKESIQN